MPKGMLITIGGLVVGLITVLVLYSLGYKQTAETVGMVGPFVVFFPVIFWIVFFDSKKRWPNDRWFTRFSNLMTFKR